MPQHKDSSTHQEKLPDRNSPRIKRHQQEHGVPSEKFAAKKNYEPASKALYHAYVHRMSEQTLGTSVHVAQTKASYTLVHDLNFKLHAWMSQVAPRRTAAGVTAPPSRL
jgi:hypothetical protein